jgi:hypothetical protein
MLFEKSLSGNDALQPYQRSRIGMNPADAGEPLRPFYRQGGWPSEEGLTTEP